METSAQPRFMEKDVLHSGCLCLWINAGHAGKSCQTLSCLILWCLMLGGQMIQTPLPLLPVLGRPRSRPRGILEPGKRKSCFLLVLCFCQRRWLCCLFRTGLTLNSIAILPHPPNAEVIGVCAPSVGTYPQMEMQLGR